MQKNTLIVGIFILVVGIGIGYGVRGNGYTRFSGGHMMQNGSMMSQNIDEHFITQMIPHHEGAIEMAKIALERSKRPEVISLANGIIEAQERENTQMRSWYQSWFGKAPSTNGMGMMHMGGMEGDVSRLTTVSVTDFDKEFLTQMIPHHEMAIMMAQMLQASTEREEMKQLADQIITSQAKEIDLMRSWLKSWYGI